MNKKREIRFEIVRVTAMLLCILDHTIVLNTEVAESVVRPFLMLCNPLFFMLSGKFALDQQFDNIKSIANYYKKKFIGICIPVFVYMIVKALLEIAIEIRNGNLEPQLVKIVQIIFSDILGNGFKAADYWFIYILLGFLLITPYISNAFRDLSIESFRVLIVISFAFNILITYLPLVGIEFALQFPFGSWFLYFVLGCYLERAGDTERRYLIFLGSCSTLFNVLLCYFGIGNGATSIAPAFTLMSVACYLILSQHIFVKSKLLERLILYLGRHSFSIYLIHIYSIVIAQRILDMIFKTSVNWFIVYVPAVIVSLILSICIDTFAVQWLQFIAKKLLINDMKMR